MTQEHGTVAILAGSGELPLLLAQRLTEAGRPHRILAFRGFADRALKRRADAVVGLLDVQRSVACLDAWRPDVVTLAGGLARPSASAAIDAFAAYRSREELREIVARGDDNLLRGVVALIEDRGHRLVGVKDLAPGLLTQAGPYGVVTPDAKAAAEIRHGLRFLSDISPYDVGQAVVVADERVIAVEGPEGTDRMLTRAASLENRWLRRKRPKRGVLVKAPKRGQDLRVDLPAIGPRTILMAARAGLAGIAVASGATIVLNRAMTTIGADRLGLFVVGVALDGWDEAP